MQQNDTAPCTLTSLGPCGLHPDRSEPNRSNSFCTPRPPFWGRGGAARESGVAGEEKGLATLVAAPFLSGQPPPAPTRRDTTRPVTTRPELIDFARAVQSRTLRILGYKRRRGRSHAPTPA